MKKKSKYSNKKKICLYIKSHNLVNKISNLLNYFKLFENQNLPVKELKYFIRQHLLDIFFIETLTRYLEDKLYFKGYNKKFRSNLVKIIKELEKLKDLLEKDLQF